jgi:rRNA maturation endonuclease Nob1
MSASIQREEPQVIDELRRNKDLLESILKEKLQEIDARRRKLDSLECKAVEDMLTEDKEYQTLASTNLEQAISAPETIQHSFYFRARDQQIDYDEHSSHILKKLNEH